MDLRLKDVDLDVLEVTIPSGKGDRERVTVLPGSAVPVKVGVPVANTAPLAGAVSTGARQMADPMLDGFQIGHAAATCLARAIARGVYEARAKTGDLQQSWQGRFG